MHTDGGAPHIKGLDGLRGLAVLAVIAFHAGQLRGGYLGVDLFFVLSGYLITTLLLREQRRTGGIALGHFWNRRARRLLPALLLVLAVVAMMMFGAGPLERTNFRSDALGTLFYVANWVTIRSGSDYFAQFAGPSPLQHTWSLAIEEQFYLLWPIVALVVATRIRRGADPGRGDHAGLARRLLALALIGATISSAAMIASRALGTDTNRLYLGTDTRVAAILWGAALAAALSIYGPIGPGSRRVAIEVGGWLGMAALAAAWWRLDGRSSALYRGGLLICGLAAVAVIASVTQAEHRPLARLLSWSPLSGVGLISYGLYLWHWPIFVWVTPSRVGLDGLALTALRLSLTLAVSLLSYFLVEMPIRRGAVSGAAAKIVTPVCLVGVVLLVVMVGSTPPVALDADTAAQAVRPLGPLGPLGQLRPLGGVARTTPVTPVTIASAAADRPARVLLVGDSVGDSVAKALIPYQASFGIEARSEARSGCGLLRTNPEVRLANGVTRSEDECLDLMAQWGETMLAWRPDVVLVILGWPGQTERLVEGEYRQPCDPTYDDWYRNELRAALDLAGSSGARVYLTTVPYFRSSRAPAGTDAKTDCLNRLYRDEAAKLPKVTIIDLATFICPNASCRTEQNGVAWRPDGLHFEGSSSVWVTDWLLQQIWSQAQSVGP